MAAANKRAEALRHIRELRTNSKKFDAIFRAYGHEAGHAVVGLALGLRVQSLNVNVVGARYVFVRCHFPRVWVDRDEIMRRLTFTVAGPVAESMLPGAPARRPSLSRRIRGGEIESVDLAATFAAGEKVNDMTQAWYYSGLILEGLDGWPSPTNARRARLVAEAERSARAILNVNYDAWRALTLAPATLGDDKRFTRRQIEKIVGPLTLPAGLEAKGAASDNGTRGGKGKAGGGGRGGRCAAKWS